MPFCEALRRQRLQRRTVESFKEFLSAGAVGAHRAGVEIHDAPETVVATIVTVSESVLEAQTEEGAAPEVVGEAPAEPEAGE